MRARWAKGIVVLDKRVVPYNHFPGASKREGVIAESIEVGGVQVHFRNPVGSHQYYRTDEQGATHLRYEEFYLHPRDYIVNIVRYVQARRL